MIIYLVLDDSVNRKISQIIKKLEILSHAVLAWQLLSLFIIIFFKLLFIR